MGNINDLYNKVKSIPNSKVPDLETFKSMYNSEEGMNKVYSKLKSTPDVKLPDFETFKSIYYTPTTSASSKGIAINTNNTNPTDKKTSFDSSGNTLPITDTKSEIPTELHDPNEFKVKPADQPYNTPLPTPFDIFKKPTYSNLKIKTPFDVVKTPSDDFSYSKDPNHVPLFSDIMFSKGDFHTTIDEGKKTISALPPETPFELFLKKAAKDITGTFNPDINKLPEEEQDYFMQDAYNQAKAKQNQYNSIIESNLPWKEKSDALTASFKDVYNGLIDEKLKLDSSLSQTKTYISVLGAELENYKKKIIESKKAPINSEEANKIDYYENQKKLTEERLNKKKEDLSYLLDSLDKYDQDKEGFKKLSSTPANYMNPLADATRNHPYAILNMPDQDIVFDAAKFNIEGNTMFNEELKKGSLFPFEQTYNGVPVKELFKQKYDPLKVLNTWDILKDVTKSFFNVGDFTKGIVLPNEKLEEVTFKKIGFNKEYLQQNAYEGVVNLLENVANNKKAYENARFSLMGAKAGAIADAKKENKVIDPASLQKIDNKIIDLNNRISYQDPLSIKLTKILNTYFGDYRKWINYKNSVNKEAELVDAASVVKYDIAQPLWLGTGKLINSVPHALGGLKDVAANKVGLMSKDEQVANQLYNFNEEEYNRFNYVPEPIKGQEFFKLNYDENGNLNLKDTKINVRAGLREGIKTTAESFLLAATGEALGAAVGLEALLGAESAGTIANYFSNKVGIIPASNLLLNDDILQEEMRAYINGDVNAINKVLFNTGVKTTIEGGTEMLWTPELNLIKNIGKYPVQGFAVSQLFKKALGQKLITPELKYLLETITTHVVKVPAEEATEEIAGNLLTDMYSNANKGNSLDVTDEKQFTFKNNIETAVNTAMSMLPTMLMGLGSSYVGKYSYLKSLNQDIAANSDQYLDYAKDFIYSDISDAKLKKLFPDFVSKDQLFEKVKETSEIYKQSYNEAKPVLNLLNKNSEKEDYLNKLIEFKQLTINKSPQELEKNIDKINELTTSINSYHEKVNAIREEFNQDYLKATANNLPNTLAKYDFNSPSIPVLETINKDIDELINLFSDRNGKYDKELTALNGIKTKLTERISSLQNNENLIQDKDEAFSNVGEVIEKEEEEKQPTPFESFQEKINTAPIKELDNFLQDALTAQDEGKITEDELDNLYNLYEERKTKKAQEPFEFNRKTYVPGSYIALADNPNFYYKVKAVSPDNQLIVQGEKGEEKISPEQEIADTYTKEEYSKIQERKKELEEFAKKQAKPTEDIETEKNKLEEEKDQKLNKLFESIGLPYTQKNLDIIAERSDKKAIAFIEQHDTIIAEYEKKLAALEEKEKETKKEEIKPEKIVIDEEKIESSLEEPVVTKEEKLTKEEKEKEEIVDFNYTEEDIQKETEALIEQINKQAEETADKFSKSFDYFGSAFDFLTATKNKTKWAAIQRALIKLNDLLSKGESLEELGIYATVKRNFLPENQLIELPNEKFTWKDITDGVIVILTDKEGNPLYFDDEGNFTKDNVNGHIVYKNFIGYYESGKKTVPSQKELTNLGLTDYFNQSTKNVEQVRESLEGEENKDKFFIYKIKDITPFVSPLNKEIPLSVDNSNATYTVTNATSKSKPRINITLKNSGITYSTVMPTFKEAGLYDTLIKLLDLNITEGLPKNITFEDRRKMIESIYNTYYGLRFILDKEANKIVVEYILKGQTNKEILSIEKWIERDTPENKHLNVNFKYKNIEKGFFDFYIWNGNSFVKYEEGYNDLILSKVKKVNVNIPENQPRILLGDKVVEKKEEISSTIIDSPTPTEPKESKENTEITDNQPIVKSKFDFSKFSKNNNTLNDNIKPLDRLKTLSTKVTELENKKAEEWFNKYLKQSNVTFNDWRNIVNSTKWAEWKKGAITLYNGANFTDGYHEAFHDFTQMYLTKEQKVRLYEEIAKTDLGKKAIEKALKEKKEKFGDKAELTNYERYLAVEELLAEDFRNYMLSEQKLILNQRPARNSIFRRIYNFLKELFTNQPSLDTIYKSLANNTLSGYNRNIDNAMFGVLNSANIPGLDTMQTMHLMDAINSLLAKEFRNASKSLSYLFKDKATLKAGYDTVFNTILVTSQELNNEYEKLAAKYEKAEGIEKENIKSQLTDLERVLSFSAFTLNNWDNVVRYHIKNSNYLKIANEIEGLLDTDFDEEENTISKESMYEDDGTRSVREKASLQLIYLVASLPDSEFVDGQSRYKSNPLLDYIENTVAFDNAWNKIADLLKGTLEYKDQYAKIQERAKKDLTFQALLASLPEPNAKVDELTLQLKNQFTLMFSQPLINMNIARFRFKDGVLKVLASPATVNSISKVQADWIFNLQSTDNQYNKINSDGKRELDLDKVLEDFSKSMIKKFRKLEFLAALGINFSKKAESSEALDDFLSKAYNIQTIYDNLKKIKDIREGKMGDTISKRKADQPIYSIFDALGKDLRTEDKGLIFSGLQGTILKQLADIEISEGDKYFADNRVNAEGSSTWGIRPYSQQAMMFAYLNDYKNYPNLAALINSPIGAVFNREFNPDANNLYINALFDKNGERRLDKNNKPIQLSLENHDGMTVSIDDDFSEKGNKTASLSRFLKLVQDFSTLLISGHKEHIRYGDKTTSYSTLTEFTHSVSPDLDRHIPVNVVDFKDSYLPDEAYFNFKRRLLVTLFRTNQFTALEVNKNAIAFAANLKNKEYFGFFEGIFTKETKEKLAKAYSKEAMTYEQLNDLINENKDSIKKDLTDFLKRKVDAVEKELLSNKNLEPKNFIDNYLLTKYDLPTLIRAFYVNSYILNMEHIALFFQDIRFYDNKKGTYKEPYKRFSKATSTGTRMINDDQTNAYLGTDNGQRGVVIFNDITLDKESNATKEFLEELNKIYEKSSLEQKLAIQKAYSDIKITDAFGGCLPEFYREFKIKSATDNWNPEKDRLFQKIMDKKPLTDEEMSSSLLFFPPLKLRLVGFTQDPQTGQVIPFDAKFAVSPLLGSVVANTNYGKLAEKMKANNASIFTYSSAIKHSGLGIVDENGKVINNSLYDKEGNFNEEEPFVVNPVFQDFIYEVVTSPEDYKEYVTFSTQLRKLLFLNSYNQGIPTDYKVKGKNWFDLSEEEKLKASKIYTLDVKVSDAIQNLINLGKQEILEKLDAKLSEDGQYYNLDKEKLSEFLETEFKKRNLPISVLQSLKLEDGKLAPLDTSLQRQTIESIIISVVDNKLRKQKGIGESLIQAASPGYESATLKRADSWGETGGWDLPYYKDKGRKLPDGTFVTSAHKVKVALQGDFVKLLDLNDVKQLAENEQVIKEAKEKGGSYTPELVALNRLIKDEKWLDKNNIRELISITGVRIPVQGHNSMEFMEVYEFLPKEAGPIIIVSPALVGKSGGDFDWDKITSLFNSFDSNFKLYTKEDLAKNIDKNYYNKLKELLKEKEEYTVIKNELKTSLDEYKKDKDFSKLAKKDLKYNLRLLNIEIAFNRQTLDLLNTIYENIKETENVSTNDVSILSNFLGTEIAYNREDLVLSAINNKKQEIQNKIEEFDRIKKVLIPIMDNAIAMSQEEINYSKKSLKNLYDKLNEKQDIITNLIRQNSFKKAYNNIINNSIRQILEKPENIQQLLTPNATDLFEDFADERREALSNQKGIEKASYSDIPDVLESLNQHESNNVGKRSLGILAITNVFFSQLQRAGAYLNKEFKKNPDSKKSREVNHWLAHNKTKNDNISLSHIYDVENKNLISEAVSQLMNGAVDVAKKDWLFYINGVLEVIPAMGYVVQTGTPADHVSAFFTQPSIYNYAKKLRNYKSLIMKAANPELYANAKLNAIYDTIQDYASQITFDENDPYYELSADLEFLPREGGEFWKEIQNEIPNQINENFELLSLFDFKEYSKFSVPTKDKDGKLTLQEPKTNKELVGQIMYLIQFLEFMDQQSVLSTYRTTMNQDSTKPSTIQSAKERLIKRSDLDRHGLLPSEILTRLTEESTTKGFTSDNSGIDRFIFKLTKELFEVTNSDIFNNFLFNELNRPFEIKYFYEKGVPKKVISYGSNMPFDSKFANKDSWVKSVKNDFIEYLIKNNLYLPEDPTKKVINYYYSNLINPNTGLYKTLDYIKENYPNLVKANLLLQYLEKYLSKQKTIAGNPRYISLKLRTNDLDPTTLNVLEEGFNNLINFNDDLYTPEDQLIIQKFGKDLAYLAYFQSGLNRNDVSFTNIVPPNFFAREFSIIINKFKELIDNQPITAKKEIETFYRLFKRNNQRFFKAQDNLLTNEKDISFAVEPKIGKNYNTSEAYDLLGKNEQAKRLLIEKKENEIKSKTKISEISYDKNTAIDNPKNLYIYESNPKNLGLYYSMVVKETKETDRENTINIPTFESFGVGLSDKNLPKNKEMIDIAISDILAKVAQFKPKEIILPIAFGELSKQSAPSTYQYLKDQIKNKFGVDLESSIFEQQDNTLTPTKSEEESPEVEETITEVKPTTIGEEIVTGYQGRKQDKDNRKYNYYTTKKSEAYNYGPILESQTVNLQGYLRKYIKTEKGQIEYSKEYTNLSNEFKNKTGKIFDILNNSKEGIEIQNSFFEFLENKGYKGYTELIKDMPEQDENTYFVTFSDKKVKDTITKDTPTTTPIVELTKEIKPENISSKGSEFAKKLTNVGNTIGLTYKGKQYVNSEHAYQTWKSGEFNQEGYNLKGGKVRGGKIGDTFSIMTDILTEKLKQHPELVQGINERGGLAYIEQSTHNVIGDKFWESTGQNKFIEALAQAYKNVQPTVGAVKPTVEITTVNYTKDTAPNNPDIGFIFTENAEMLDTNKNVSMTQAVIRTDRNGNKNPNALPIITKKLQVAGGQWTNSDEDFNEFVKLNTDLINRIKNSNYKKFVFPQGFATDKAKMPTRFAEWLQKALLDNFGLVTELNATKTGLISKSVQPITQPTVQTTEEVSTKQQLKDFYESLSKEQKEKLGNIEDIIENYENLPINMSIEKYIEQLKCKNLI